MTLPRRRENKRMCKVVMDCNTEQQDYRHTFYNDSFYFVEYPEHNHEDAIWPLGNNKPHYYYW